MKNLKDSDFIRSKIPMTKFNIRNLSLAYMSLEKGDFFLDIGGGTGSIAVEAALQGADVITVEEKNEACRLIEANSKKFAVDIKIIEGAAPQVLLSPEYEYFRFDKCFVGGSRGKLKKIFEYLNLHLKKGGILCAAFILISNLNEFLNLLKEFSYSCIEVNLIQTASMEDTGLFKGENPVYIVKAVR